MKHWLISTALAAAALGAVTTPAHAQRASRSRDSILKSAFSDISDRHRFSVGLVRIGTKNKAYGVLVRENRLLTVAAPLAGVKPGQLRVRFQGDTTYPAQILARDERWNLALLAVEPEELVDPVPLKRHGTATVGRWVVSVGTRPLPHAVGAVSAVNRAVVEQDAPAGGSPANPAAALVGKGRRYREVFQHDSTLTTRSLQGAPMFDSRGRFVGISVETRTRGTSYALPAKRVLELLPRLLAGTSTAGTRPGFIGIQAGFLSPEEAKKKGIAGGVPVRELVKIKDEYRGAAKAGIKVGDIITKVDGQAVLEIQSLQEVVQLFNPGEKVVFTVLRDDKSLDFTVTIEERPSR